MIQKQAHILIKVATNCSLQFGITDFYIMRGSNTFCAHDHDCFIPIFSIYSKNLLYSRHSFTIRAKYPIWFIQFTEFHGFTLYFDDANRIDGIFAVPS